MTVRNVINSTSATRFDINTNDKCVRDCTIDKIPDTLLDYVVTNYRYFYDVRIHEFRFVIWAERSQQHG